MPDLFKSVPPVQHPGRLLQDGRVEVQKASKRSHRNEIAVEQTHQEYARGIEINGIDGVQVIIPRAVASVRAHLIQR
ncbi:MAG: hypothetical protein ACLP0J_01780 [Solirubrobacteraceae bacterium]